MDLFDLVILLITHALAYCWGHTNGADKEPSEEAWIEVEKHDIDSYYAHMRWITERKDHHDS